MSAVQQRREAAIAARKAALEAQRKRGVQAIKAAQRQMGLDDGAYRDLLAAQTRTDTFEGKRSATELTLPEQARVLDYMRRHGAAHPTRSGGRKRTATPAPDRAALMARVHALLAEFGRVTGEAYSLAYADAIAKRNGWASAVDFCDGPALTKLVGALSRTLRSKAKAKGLSNTF
jgi:phage gp16-like protein